MPRPISYAVFCLKKKNRRGCSRCGSGLWTRDGTLPALDVVGEGRGGLIFSRAGMTEMLKTRWVVCAAGALAVISMGFFFNDTATTEIYTLSLHDALPISLQVGYANHFYRSAHKFEQICRHRLRRQNVGYSNFSQPQSHLSFCVLLQYLVERRRVVTQLGKLD